MRKLLCFHIVLFGHYYVVPSMRTCIQCGGLFCHVMLLVKPFL
jgi:hypothetical protein